MVTRQRKGLFLDLRVEALIWAGYTVALAVAALPRPPGLDDAGPGYEIIATSMENSQPIMAANSAENGGGMAGMTFAASSPRTR